MSLTYTSALERDASRASKAPDRVGTGYLLLLATSLVAVLAIGLAYAGRTRAFELSEAGGELAQAINLSTVADAQDLERVFERLFASPSDRRFAAEQLFLFTRASADEGRGLPNVGAILSVSVPVETVERTSGLVEYSERLRTARERAAAAGSDPPRVQPLFTAADLATLKPALVVRTREAFRRAVVLYGALYIVGFHLVALVWRLRGVRGDRLLLAGAHLLTALGFAMLVSRPDPLRDTLLFVRFSEAVLIGLAFMGAVSFVNFRTAAFLELSYIPLIGAFSLSVLLILFGTGPGTSNAKVNLGPVQPIEAIRLLLALFLAGYFARRWELLRQIRVRTIRDIRLPAWLTLPRGDYVLPVLVAVAVALVLFFLQKDLGPALFLSFVFLAMYAIARGRVAMATAGLVLLAAGFYAGFRLHVSETLAQRVAMWQSPWDNALRGGDQIAQALWALSMGGPFGTGLGLGDTRYLPAGHTDLMLAAVGEELGLTGLLVVAAAYSLMAWRGVRIGRAAANDYGFFLAMSVTLFLVVPVLVMGAGVLGVIPLTGVVTPFLSYGGSAMTANLAALGILAAMCGDQQRPRARLDPFRVGTRNLATALGAGALALVAAIVNVQMVHGDEYVVKPHLSLQGDGVRRYQYNPRVLDIVRRIPRGTVYDRQGLPLASDDRAVLVRSRQQYRALGVSLDQACPNPVQRCYPLGGLAFHLLGDSRTRLNWAATNTSYVERDAEDRLRGFEHHRELVPILRHRYEPNHPDVKAVMARSRDLRLTVDARFQSRVASALAERARGRKAAAVVLDPNTGEVLAMASYPWPVESLDQPFKAHGDGESDALLDRARYGLYPPGSTFKMVTAVAALRRNIGLGRTAFTCRLLKDGRVGARVGGWLRPVRDDVLVTRPHGSIDMHDGIVHSCNAYFAQLAARLGPEALVDAAAPFGILLTPSNSLRRVRETLPQVGYGQGDVVTTPIRMARVAAAIAADGTVRETRLETAPPGPPGGKALLPPDAAHLLAKYLRDAVVSGTGRRLSAHPWRIAGKTGTAEVAGSPSHAWFVGFAPYGAATRRIAFAVIIENAGYGSATAAPVAGEIVTAAASAGLIR